MGTRDVASANQWGLVDVDSCLKGVAFTLTIRVL